MSLTASHTLKMQDAAALLNVSPSTLRSWEQRFGYPLPLRSAGGHRMYQRGEIVALRDALQEGLSVTSAIGRAQQALGSRPEGLVSALAALDFASADRAMESALALGTVERTVEEVLLASFPELAKRTQPGGAPWMMAAGWARDWLGRTRRISAPPAGVVSLLIGDVSRQGEFDQLALSALELFCERAGAQITTVPVSATAGLSEVLRQRPVDVVVLAGANANSEAAVRWTYEVQRLLKGRLLARYRNAAPSAEALAAGEVLDAAPVSATAQLLARGRLGAARSKSPKP